MEKQKLLNRLLLGMFLYSIVINFILEPLSLLSSRIPSGSDDPLPTFYVRSWVGADNDGEINVYFDVIKSKATFKIFTAGEGTETIKCDSYDIFYEFERNDDRFLHAILENLKYFFLPDTLFGIQKIKFDCDKAYLWIHDVSLHGIPELYLDLLKPKENIMAVGWFLTEK